MKTLFTFEELWPNNKQLKKRAAWLLQRGHAKTEILALQTLYTEMAVERFIIDNPEVFGALLIGPRQKHPWEHDIKTTINNKEERIDVKSLDNDDYWKKGFSIGFHYKDACQAELPTKYVGTLISYIDKTVSVAYWQESDIIIKFAEEHFIAYSEMSKPRAILERRHKYCIVPFTEWIKI